MIHRTQTPSVFHQILSAVGPGIFCVGYTIGTGSVTSMIVAGSEHGMKLLWVLVFSCLFSGVLMEAYGRFAIVTGRTSISSFRSEFGKKTAILVAIMVVLGQWCCLSGLVGLSSYAVFEGIQLIWTTIDPRTTLFVAIFMLAIVYYCLWFGSYKRFETILVLLVSLMGLSFLLSLFFVPPTTVQVAEGLVPTIPKGDYLLVAAFVGTTMAAPTFIVRPILLTTKGWTFQEYHIQTRDAIVSAVLMFVVSASIMACSTGSIFNMGGEPVKSISDMTETLKPLTGHFATAIFLVGVVCAGISSIFPILIIAPVLLADYRSETMVPQKTEFRVLALIACFIGLMVPVLGANPVYIQVLTQAAQVFVLPLVIGGITILINRRSLMGEYRAGWLLNLGLGASFFFSLLISYCGIIAIRNLFYQSILLQQ
ncbi:MAG: Nramp family divalent metal transporter [Planctomycetaceae bacterium]|jgi:Mn2+/Fe2+ NRAMP family transporter|nr:Nramp family divalent metal transporter [Planctomycetaceae bacterium]